MPPIPISQPLSPEIIERIARAIHERYCRNQRNRKPASDPALQPWDALPESLRDSNRAQAEAIPGKLGLLGYRIAGSGAAPVTALTDGELERLARAEHDRWVEERREAGWTLGPERDVERRRTPHLVPWEELPEEIREYDRDAVRAIPAVLAEAGLGVYRS